MVARASDPSAEAARRPRGWTLHSLPADEAGAMAPETPQTGPEAVLEASTDLCGRLLGARYDVRELLGHGERGAVYLANDRNHGRVVALRLAAPLAVSAAAEDVRVRARRRMGVRHAHLATVVGEGLTEGGLHYVAMEHVEGRNLHHMLGDPRLAWPAVHTIAVQMAEALVALHGAWVVHGDVHAGNLVWVEDGERPVFVKLVDLDVAGAFDAAAGEREMSGDVAALVATLYELATGQTPDPRLSALTDAAEIPGWFADLLRSVLMPGAGIPSARALLASLRQGMGGVPARSGPVAAAVPVPVVVPPVVSGPMVAARGLSGPVPMALPPVVSGPMVAARGLSGPVPMVSAPVVSGPVAVKIPGPTPAARLPDPATEDELWFAAVAEFDPLQHLETVAAAEAVASPDVVVVVPEVVAPAGFDAAELGPPPSFGGALEPDTAPAMVTMQAAFDPRPTPVLGGFADPTPLELVVTPGATLTDGYTSAAAVLATSRRNRRWGATAVAALVLALLVWQLGSGAPPPATPVPTSPVAQPNVRVATPPVASAPVKPAVQQTPVVEQPEPAAPTPVEEPPPPAAEVVEPAMPASGTAASLSAAEFRQIMLRSNRSPAVVACYMQHTAGVEQRVEAVLTVGPRGRVSKLRVDAGPLGDCIRGVVEKLDFPDSPQPARHNFVFRTPVD